jgi:hypothetical protein
MVAAECELGGEAPHQREEHIPLGVPGVPLRPKNAVPVSGNVSSAAHHSISS